VQIVEEEVIDFDIAFLGFGPELGAAHAETPGELNKIRREFEGELLLSNEAIKFCDLIVLHGMLPSQAYTQAFARVDEYGVLVKPEAPAYQAKELLKLHEIREYIEDRRAEIREWSKTEVEEIELNLRSIAFNPTEKSADRIAANKALAQLKGFGVQDGNQPGATIVFQMPFVPKNLGHQPTLVLDNESGNPV
jgi:hypothetical protein